MSSACTETPQVIGRCSQSSRMIDSRVVFLWRLYAILFLVVAVFADFSNAIETRWQALAEVHQSPGEIRAQHVLSLPPPQSPIYHSEPSRRPSTDNSIRPTNPTLFPTENNILRDLHNALSTMQDHYFSLWLGTWMTAIDWTGAVMGTYVSATLSSLSRSIDYTMPGTFDVSRKLDVEAQMVENEINKYFAHSTSYYFGQDHFAIRMQAFDDMLWVVLGWLEATNFISSHSATHYEPGAGFGQGEGRQGEWHARQFISAFAHRARVFYELAEKGWDWRLCGGGMTWNPRLLPYKNAITNQLFVSASISMYLNFPGDDICSPFLSQHDAVNSYSDKLYDDCDESIRGRYDPVYLANAVNGYDWLKNIGMTNDQGLYVDGFHISGYRQNHSKTACDERNEMVYTYNQGVILSGLRGLWEATGNLTYLEDGHELIRNVIKATGWQSRSTTAKHKDTLSSDWHGLGSNGILTELCDPSGQCNQDGQTFKGIFFHHLTAFCTPLPTHPARPGKTYASTREIHTLHQRSCNEYVGWVVHNAQAALRTRDEQGRFGAWWGASDSAFSDQSGKEGSEVQKKDTVVVQLPHGAVDYHNTRTKSEEMYSDPEYAEPAAQDLIAANEAQGDLNHRGRGRTVETQGGGVAVVRAMWEFLRRTERRDL
ncbi:glycoside hydrolase family 76 protein [Cucurbitaria berberidis CBS 394.84]|uniref:Glycoside hydrolase family 76 protein n=1 Tax=Cucurbitaria berberidis CBS 394.84 TaxID=1168544 RepID=A0A9P4GIL4_9PLEO|nr:glycoside hydrolase family 76 protein [Cucurbitaria berberidis CBS 394.84]KAF1846091.1 glycoside hydrolase family 76 protein [Cucurbitaria berberidis CBS 394.84]